MRGGIVLVIGVVACYSRTSDVPCDGVLDPGEFCDDGDRSDGDGCDCAARLIELAPDPAMPNVPTVLVENGAWCWFQDERVIIDGTTIIAATISHGGDIQVSSYEPLTGRRVQSVLYTRLERDDHDVPSLMQLADGRIAAFFTRHDGFPHLYTRVTERPNDVATWQDKHVTSFPFDVTYTNPFQLASHGDRTFMFLRGIDTNPTLVTSDDVGASWSEGAQLMNAGERNLVGAIDHRPYVKYASDGGGTVHLLYTDGHPAEFRKNSIYHLVFRDETLMKSDGTRVARARGDDQPLLQPSSGTLVYDGRVLPGGQAWTWDAAVDAEGDPIVVFSTFPDPARPFYDHRYRYARWNGSAWQVHTIAFGGTGIYLAEGFYSGGITIDPNFPGVVYFASNVDPITGEPTASSVFEIYRGVTSDEGATWTITPVTTGSRVNNLRPIVPAGHIEPTTVLWMRGSYDAYLDYRTQIVALIGDANAMANTPQTLPSGLVELARFDLAATSAGPATPTAPGFVAAVPAAGVASAQHNGISLVVSNITGTRDAVVGDPLYRGLVFCERDGYEPSGKLRVDLGGLVPGTSYVVRVHGRDVGDAYLEPTLWFRGGTASLIGERNEDFVGGHRNVNGMVAGEGAVDFVLDADADGKITLIGRGLNETEYQTTAVLAGIEVLERPASMLLARFDVDAPGGETAPNATSISFDDTIAWSGEATANGLTLRVTSDRILSLRKRESSDPMLADFIFGRDQLVVDLAGLEPGRLYEITVYGTDLESNAWATSRWRLDEPGRAPFVVHDFHMNMQLTGPGASFTFFHRASTTTLRLRAEDVITSLSSNPSVVIFNGMDIHISP